MLTPKQLHEYQKECVLHMLRNDDAMLWLQMGLGKTVIALTAIVDRMRAGLIRKTVIFGPLRVIQSVWTTEAQKWSHTKHLTFSIITGTPQQRIRAMFREADVYLINYENMNWFAETITQYFPDGHPFQAVIYDEVSKVKNSTSLRIAGGKRDRTNKATGESYVFNRIGWRKFINTFKYRVGLTGTPASNGYIDLHGQFLAVDGGVRLGERVSHYRAAYFNTGFNGWGYNITPLGKEWIERRISDITIKMDSKDYLDMPDVKVTNIMVELPPKIRAQYKELEKEMFIELDSGTEIEVFNKASLSNKCLQFCNGSPYTDPLTKEWEALHDVKLKALESVLEEAGGSPVLCSYTFKSDAERIMKYLKKIKPVNLTVEPAKKTQSIINKWNKGDIKLLIGHPASMGHGIDGLQESGSIIVWFGMPWSLELYEQMNGRLNRQGQTKPVTIIHILCDGTVDLAVLDANERKESDQTGLKASLDRYRGVEEKVNFY